MDWSLGDCARDTDQGYGEEGERNAGKGCSRVMVGSKGYSRVDVDGRVMVGSKVYSRGNVRKANIMKATVVLGLWLGARGIVGVM